MLRVISGGQTGVDRAALDVAIDLRIPHGGWCPRGRRAEDGRIASRYLLQETASRDYWVRTEMNVVDSDATLILYKNALRGGSELTYRMTKKHLRPALCLDLSVDQHLDVSNALQWLYHAAVNTLNVAGPRESSCVGIYDTSRHFLHQLLSPLAPL